MVTLGTNTACASPISYIKTGGTVTCGTPPTGVTNSISCQSALTSCSAGYPNYIVTLNRLSPSPGSTNYTIATNSYTISSANNTVAYTYEVSYKGKCSNGSVTAASIPTVFTMYPTTVSAIQNLNISNVICNKMTVSWSPDPSAINGYQLYVQRAGTSGNSYSVTSTSVNLTGLVAGATYSIWVKGKACNNTFSASSNTLTQTLPSVCPARLAAPTIDSNIIEVLESEISSFDMEVYPNPSSGKFNVELQQEGYNGAASIQLFNSMGQLIINEKENFTDGKLKKYLEMNDAVNGNYFLKVQTDKGLKTSMLHIEK
jgi:hypothetical protein